MNRRTFLNVSGSFAALQLLSPSTLVWATDPQPQRLSYWANKGTQFEGQYEASNIIGSLPTNLAGSLYRLAPGQKNTHGQALNHLFDGDAYLTSLNFLNQKVQVRSEFLRTPERDAETQSQKMLYKDFGTRPRGRNSGNKSAPNINLIAFQDKLLAFSESRQAFGFNKDTWQPEGLWSFNDTWPENVNFTAHPKKDPRSGLIYAYGLEQSLSLKLHVYEIDPQAGTAKPIYSGSQSRASIIHDMMITENYIILVIPPLYMSWVDLVFGDKTMAESIKYDSKSESKILVIPKSGNTQVKEFSFPNSMCFHHGNAYEDGDKLIFHSFISPDESAFQVMSQWRSPNKIQAALPALTRFQLDLTNDRVLEQVELFPSCDYPALNFKTIGDKQDSLVMAEISNISDPMAPQAIVKYNFSNDSVLRYAFEENEVCGEPVLSEHHILCMGYNRQKNESFLEVLDQEKLHFQARVWLGRQVPMGFHGFFEN